MSYNKFLGKDYGRTYVRFGNIEIGPKAFKTTSLLKATMIHEQAHSIFDRIMIDYEMYADPLNPTAWNYGDGTRGYISEIQNAGRMHIRTSAFKLLEPSPGDIWRYGNRFFKDQIPINPVWYAPGVIKSRWTYLIPRRF